MLHLIRCREESLQVEGKQVSLQSVCGIQQVCLRACCQSRLKLTETVEEKGRRSFRPTTYHGDFRNGAAQLDEHKTDSGLRVLMEGREHCQLRSQSSRLYEGQLTANLWAYAPQWQPALNIHF